ncbi:MAG: seryl-tRNA synthetase [candidate division Zixibacteria bacterium SM23_73]|nr:MAG: seryl-tRNA synthetase [candidate division Zixibacteria bacterium SM23_73]
MLDLKFIRENSEKVREAARNKGEKVDVDLLVNLDEKRRTLLLQADKLKHQRNVVSDKIAHMKKEKQDPGEQIEKMRKVAEQIDALDEKLRELEAKINDLLLTIPNIPHPSVPIGMDEDSNVVLRSWGETRRFDFEPRPHWELGQILGILDLPKAAKVAGSGFLVLTGKGARLQRALINFMLDLHTHKHNYKEILPPYMANRASMTGTGQLPKLEYDMYLCEKEDLFLIPTAEVPVTNLHREETLKEDDLPVYYTAYSACFRREAGAYGKDTRGMIRVHQFDKVEMVKIVKPENSYDELESLLKDAEEVLQLLNLPYRVRVLCTGDLSFAAAKCYDIEAWCPGLGNYQEVSSCSNFEDFQARRMLLRFRPKGGGKLQYAHTLNGSGVALPRTMIALLENYQTEKGTVVVPEVLRPYMESMEVIE